MRTQSFPWWAGAGLTLSLTGCMTNPPDDSLPRATAASLPPGQMGPTKPPAKNLTSTEEMAQNAAFRKAVNSPSSHLVETARPVGDDSVPEKTTDSVVMISDSNGSDVPRKSIIPAQPEPVAAVPHKTSADVEGTGFSLDNLDVTDATLQGQLDVQRIGSDRTTNNLLAVSAGLKNKTAKPLDLEVQTIYKDAAQTVLTGAATWIPITLKPHEKMEYRSSSLSEDATDFVVRIRRSSSPAPDNSKPKSLKDLTPWR